MIAHRDGQVLWGYGMTEHATVERVDQLARLLDFIGSQLTKQERDQFALELLDATRARDEQGLRELLSSWLISIHVSQHPDFRAQFKEYQNLIASGELLSGVQVIRKREAQEG